MSVTSSGTTPAGSYLLTIRATSGPVTRASTVTLVVVGTFSVSATPSTRTMTRGGNTTYTVAVASVQPGASVDLAIEGLPRFASARFRPDPLIGSGNSTLSINANKNIAAGTYTLTIRATTSGTVRTTTVTLVVQ
jgi:hypothetical protein